MSSPPRPHGGATVAAITIGGGRVWNLILYNPWYNYIVRIIYTTKGDVCVCKIGPISARTVNQHVNSVRIATFQSANFGPLLFAFYCPLLFYENKIKNE